MARQLNVMRLLRFSVIIVLARGVLCYVAPKTLTSKIEASTVAKSPEPFVEKEVLDFSRRDILINLGVSLVVAESLIGNADIAMAENYTLESKKKELFVSESTSSKSAVDVKAILSRASKKALGGEYV